MGCTGLNSKTAGKNDNADNKKMPLLPIGYSEKGAVKSTIISVFVVVKRPIIFVPSIEMVPH